MIKCLFCSVCECATEDIYCYGTNCENCDGLLCYENIHFSGEDMVELCGECFHALFGEH